MNVIATIIAALAATASAAAFVADGALASSAGDLGKRACYITCYPSRAYCTWAPYNYYCKQNGRFGYDRRNTDCEDLNVGCYCSCDWTAPGIGQVGDAEGVASEGGAVEAAAAEAGDARAGADEEKV